MQDNQGGISAVSLVSDKAQTPLAIELMFEKIMDAVQESRNEISELRQQYVELQMANLNLERVVREAGGNGQHSTVHTSGFVTPICMTGSPKVRPKTPFLLPSSIPSISISSAVHVPSPLGDNSLVPQHSPQRAIPEFYAVIPAGGAGTRLWPLSREDHPKFLLDVTLCGKSLLQSTWNRLLPLATKERIAIVAGPTHTQSICEQLPDLLPNNIFTEPKAKESMAAIGLATAIIARRNPDAVIGSFAADHTIHGDDAFSAAIAEAVEVARQGYLVTIGIAPSHPAIGFGYIRLGEKLNLANASNARLVSSFKEKPDARTAANYLATGMYRWNAGMFVTRASVLMELLCEYLPDMYAGLMKVAAIWEDEKARQEVLAEVWPNLEKIAIDNAVAEPAAAQGRVAVVPATFGWDDVGDFSSLSEMLPSEMNQPKILGDQHLVLTERTAGGLIVPASGRLITCLGVDDLVIVDMPDALMVTTRARSQEVKRLVKKAREQGFKNVL